MTLPPRSPTDSMSPVASNEIADSKSCLLMAEAFGSPRLFMKKSGRVSCFSTLKFLELYLTGLRIGETTLGEEPKSEKSAIFLILDLACGERGGERSLCIAVIPDTADISRGYSSSFKCLYLSLREIGGVFKCL